MRHLISLIVFLYGLSSAVAQVHLAVVAHEDQVLPLGVCAGVEAAASEWSTVTRKPIVHKLVGVRAPADLQTGIHTVISSSRLGVVVWAAGWDANELEVVAEKLQLAGISHVILDFNPADTTGISGWIRLGPSAKDIPSGAVDVMRRSDLNSVRGTNLIVSGDHPQLIPLMERGIVSRIITIPAEEWGRYIGFQFLMKLDPEHASFFDLLPEPAPSESFDATDLEAFKERWRRWLAQ